jgi:hypothetical protein
MDCSSSQNPVRKVRKPHPLLRTMGLGFFAFVPLKMFLMAEAT